MAVGRPFVQVDHDKKFYPSGSIISTLPSQRLGNTMLSLMKISLVDFDRGGIFSQGHSQRFYKAL